MNKRLKWILPLSLVLVIFYLLFNVLDFQQFKGATGEGYALGLGFNKEAKIASGLLLIWIIAYSALSRKGKK